MSNIHQKIDTQGKNAQFKPSIAEELQPTLVAKGPGAVQNGYTVRRLTTTECARLQGFPDWWCDGLGTENPSEQEHSFWAEVFETHRRVTGTSSKPKSEAQIVKWLRKIDGAVATVMALDRAIRCGNDTGVSVYDNRGLLVL